VTGCVKWIVILALLPAALFTLFWLTMFALATFGIFLS